MFPIIKTVGHTTRSTPRAHIIYKFTLDKDGVVVTIEKRYSEFAVLHAKLGITDFDLPPKRLLVTTFIPSAWVDDALIAERKAGLQEYLVKLLKVPEYRHNDLVQEFIAPEITSIPLQEFELEDALPSTLSRKLAEELVQAAATKQIAAAYYPTWTVDDHPPEKLDYSKYDVLFVAFAIPNSSSGINVDSETQSMLKRLVSSAHKSGKGTKIVLSVGGWTGSNLSCPSTILDGIDIDWEYPKLEVALRTSLGGSKIISAAVTDLPWLGANGSPLKDVSEYAAQLTYNELRYQWKATLFPLIFLLNNCAGGWSAAPGPNAPLSNACGNSSQPAYTAQAAFKQWTAAKFPASKLLLGLPLYGYVYRSTKKTLAQFVTPEEDAVEDAQSDPPAEEPIGPIRGGNRRILIPADPEQPEPETEVVEVETPEDAVLPLGLLEPQVEAETIDSEDMTIEATANLSKWWGQAIPFNSLLASGALVKNSDGSYGAGSGYTLAQDDCSDTPFLYSTSKTTVVSYDDTHSLADKAAFAKSKGMAGCFTWSLDQDDGVTLQNAIRKGLGK
ncbi:glycoside hydrolase family 18 protein [Mycena amicta]|nr:glycoside hydrolase family 18 protein [Mycena amicta]